MSLLHIAGGATEDKLDASDVFSAYVRTGTGADVTVTTGIDYTKGFMTWTKGRSGATDHAIYDSARGVTKDLVTNSTAAQTTQTTGLKSVSTTGHTIGSLAKMNTSGATYVDWVFRKAPKFFDVVTYTGNGGTTQQIPHSLGARPGCIFVRAISGIYGTGDWSVWHRNNSDSGTTAISGMALNRTDGALYQNIDQSKFTASTFDPSGIFNKDGGTSSSNASGTPYVAYLFAHDPSADGIIQCGSFTTDGSGNGSYSTGWANGAQYALIKCSSSTGDWEIYDTARTPSWSSSDARLRANLSNAEDLVTRLSASGGVISFTGLSASQTYIIKTIRGI